MANRFFPFLLFLSINTFGQLDSALKVRLNNLIHSSEYINLAYDSSSLKLDSIFVKYKYNHKEIVAVNTFRRSKRLLTVNYYFKDSSLFYIITSEKCLTKPELTCNSEYYVVNNKIEQAEYSSVTKFSHGILSIQDLYRKHDCPSRFEYTFLEKYIWLLLYKVKSNISSL